VLALDEHDRHDAHSSVQAHRAQAGGPQDLAQLLRNIADIRMTRSVAEAPTSILKPCRNRYP